ncbi:hypothetical protein G6011_11288 [Alternaria panax]|uniref:Uncharacterized protein n=1 Tax=Alternaria panax TaxID=48097 RepID=A0AAD4IDL8_9PLEO|nr:hypothetical protein G6011_11288 [Alternaria panax]
MGFNNFELLAFFLCTSIFALLFSVWPKTKLITNREIMLLVSVFTAVAMGLLTHLFANRMLTNFLTDNVGEVHEKQLRDLAEAHRRQIASIKLESHREHLRIRGDLNNAALKFDRLYNEHDYIFGMFQEQMQHTQEQDDRIQYLEKKLQEFGQSTPVSHAPFSAPPSQIKFSFPPRRQRSDEALHSTTPANLLAQVVETEDE